jgi:hypothetical protein
MCNELRRQTGALRAICKWLVKNRTGTRNHKPSLPTLELTLDYLLGTW